ncbi:hypothetical protein J6590_023447 [Homalodisca vitripennis]|nr:hypothetical protein J6590_023447 [Homalodisca vitripennis]
MSTGLIFLCAVTFAVMAIAYSLSDESLSPSLATPSQQSDANLIGSRAVTTLKFVVAISRHGNRGPQFTYPSCPYQMNDTKFWPYGPKELTELGRIRMYNLGKQFRSMYSGFLGDIYRPGEFQAYSTSTQRTLESTELFLAGLFPPTGFQVWNRNLLWQPIPIYPNPRDRNSMVRPWGPNICPIFREDQNKSMAEFEQKYDSELNEFFAQVLPYSGYDMDTYNQTTKTVAGIPRYIALYSFWESFLHPQEDGLPLPEWSKKVYPQPLGLLMSKLLQAIAIGTDHQTRFLEGELFQEIVELMRTKVNNSLESDKKMVYYSGHDNTLLGLQAILGLNKEIIGPVKPGSVLILELHQGHADEQFYVEVLNINGGSPDLEPTHLNIPGCDSPCDFHLLLNITDMRNSTTSQIFRKNVKSTWQRDALQ